jgi:hypothetical protein
LVALPFATAIISNAGSSSDEYAQNSINMDASGNSWRGYWYDNGANMTYSYESSMPMPSGWYDCAHIVDGFCTRNTTSTSIDPLTSAKFDWVAPTPAYQFHQNHQRIVAPGEYIGTSGEGPFSFYLYGYALDGIEQNDTLDSIKYTFIDYITTYDCSYNGFVDLEINADLSFIYANNSKSFKEFEFETTNKYQYLRYDNQNSHWANDCVIGFELEFDFTGYESLSLTEFNGGDWMNTDHLIQIKSIERADGLNIGNTQIPFAGDQFWTFTATHQSVNTVQAGFIIRSATLALSFGTFALAIASTPYWDPFKNLFKGAV